MKAVIELDVPEWQIGQDVSVYFPDTMRIHGKCELLKKQEAVKPILSYGTFRCGKCENIVGYNDGHGCGYQNNFCSACGRGSEVGMSMEPVNRICPNCKNPNYMVFLGDFSKAYKYKCMNCNGYFNDIDFEKEPLLPVWKSECMNSKVDMVEVVRCKDCKYFPSAPQYEPSCWKNRRHGDDPDWFCADGEKAVK